MLNAKIDMLAKVFAGRLHVRYQKMDETFALCQSEPGNEAHWVELHRLLHSLGDAAGSFGFDELGAEAIFIELRINDMLGQQPKCLHDVNEIGQAIKALQAVH